MVNRLNKDLSVERCVKLFSHLGRGTFGYTSSPAFWLEVTFFAVFEKAGISPPVPRSLLGATSSGAGAVRQRSPKGVYIVHPLGFNVAVVRLFRASIVVVLLFSMQTANGKRGTSHTDSGRTGWRTAETRTKQMPSYPHHRTVADWHQRQRL